MKPYRRISINICFKNGQADEILEFRKNNPKITHNEVYIRGMKEIEKEVTPSPN
jgi:hypothetical protein